MWSKRYVKRNQQVAGGLVVISLMKLNIWFFLIWWCRSMNCIWFETVVWNYCLIEWDQIDLRDKALRLTPLSNFVVVLEIFAMNTWICPDENGTPTALFLFMQEQKSWNLPFLPRQIHCFYCMCVYVYGACELVDELCVISNMKCALEFMSFFSFSFSWVWKENKFFRWWQKGVNFLRFSIQTKDVE